MKPLLYEVKAFPYPCLFFSNLFLCVQFVYGNVDVCIANMHV